MSSGTLYGVYSVRGVYIYALNHVFAERLFCHTVDGIQNAICFISFMVAIMPIRDISIHLLNDTVCVHIGVGQVPAWHD